MDNSNFDPRTLFIVSIALIWLLAAFMMYHDHFTIKNFMIAILLTICFAVLGFWAGGDN